jgi:hypothetical protein
MRNVFLTSTAAACLLLAAQVAQAQEHGKNTEQKQERVQRAPDASQSKHENQLRQSSQDNRMEQRRQHDAQSAAERRQRPSTTGQSSDNNESTNKNESAGSENKPANAAVKSTDSETQSKNAQSESSKNKRENKSAAERNKNKQSEKNAAKEENKTNAASEKNKANENARSSTAQTPNKSTKSDQENAAAPTNKSNTANTTNETNTRNTANTTEQNTRVNARTQISQDKKVKISETISRHRDLAAPERNLRISINVGERVPSRIHLHPLPREIVTIAPEYRGYDYVTTEEDVVLVSPRTHEIVTRIPRDVSRARAEVSGGDSVAVTSSRGGGGMPCEVMRRTASGEMTPVSPSQLRQTTGSGGGSDRLAVKVQAPNGQEMPEVALPAREGRIIAETNGTECRITLEPGTTQ